MLVPSAVPASATGSSATGSSSRSQTSSTLPLGSFRGLVRGDGPDYRVSLNLYRNEIGQIVGRARYFESTDTSVWKCVGRWRMTKYVNPEYMFQENIARNNPTGSGCVGGSVFAYRLSATKFLAIWVGDVGNEFMRAVLTLR